jgi:hypothetical protein
MTLPAQSRLKLSLSQQYFQCRPLQLRSTKWLFNSTAQIPLINSEISYLTFGISAMEIRSQQQPQQHRMLTQQSEHLRYR